MYHLLFFHSLVVSLLKHPVNPIKNPVILSYNAKILLFGEHTVIKGSQALAMPINNFFGNWKYTSNAIEKEKLQQNLPQLIHYLAKHDLGTVINVSAFSKALNKGLYFDSSIPMGYGMGSSGALCAAIFDTFGENKSQFSVRELKKILGQIESFFHGFSSGIDPLVSYLNYPIIIEQEIRKIDLPEINKKGKGALFLLDTGIIREATPFINGFLERCKEDIYNKKCASQLVPLVDDAIHTLLHKQWKMLFHTMHELSLFQYRYFDFMILDAFKKVWLRGLSSNHFKLKICGAGGGGFLLGLSNDYSKTEKELKKYNLKSIYQY